MFTIKLLKYIYVYIYYTGWTLFTVRLWQYTNTYIYIINYGLPVVGNIDGDIVKLTDGTKQIKDRNILIIENYIIYMLCYILHVVGVVEFKVEVDGSNNGSNDGISNRTTKYEHVEYIYQ